MFPDSLSPVDYVVVLLYLLGIAWVGLWISSRGQKSTAKYFIADKQIPTWAVAFTLMATLVSSNTLVAHPANVFKTSMVLVPGFLLIPFILVGVALFVVPFYRRVVGMSAYEYIGKRFGLGGRIYTSLGFVLARVFDIGVTLVTTGIVVNVMTGWDIVRVLIVIGVFTIAYTSIGGIVAVVWTDVVQGAILMGGGLLVLAMLFFSPEAGAPGAVVAEAWRAGKFSFGSLELSWDSLFAEGRPTMWMFLAAMAMVWTQRYVCDQNMVQRYLIAKSDAEARKGALMGAALSVPILLGFNFIGACLYGFYELTSAEAPAVADHVFPHYVLNFLPQGIVGLLVAAVLAASMSSLSSDLNSVATVLTKDYFQQFLPKLSDRTHLAIGRVMVLLAGLASVMVGVAITPDEGTTPIAITALVWVTIITTGVLGLFALGFLTARATRKGCYIGIAATALFIAWAVDSPLFSWCPVKFGMNSILINPIGQLIMFGVGYAASVLFGGYRPENVEELVVRFGRRATNRVSD